MLTKYTRAISAESPHAPGRNGKPTPTTITHAALEHRKKFSSDPVHGHKLWLRRGRAPPEGHVLPASGHGVAIDRGEPRAAGPMPRKCGRPGQENGTTHTHKPTTKQREARRDYRRHAHTQNQHLQQECVGGFGIWGVWVFRFGFLRPALGGVAAIPFHPAPFPLFPFPYGARYRHNGAAGPPRAHALAETSGNIQDKHYPRSSYPPGGYGSGTN